MNIDWGMFGYYLWAGLVLFAVVFGLIVFARDQIRDWWERR